MSKTKRVLTLLTSFLLVSAVACSKESAQQGATAKAAVGAGLLDNQLLNKMPTTSFGFLVWETTSDAYKKFSASPWGNVNSISDSLESLKTLPAEGPVKTLQSLGGIVEKSGLIAPAAGQPHPVKEGVVFLSYADGAKAPDASMYITGNQGTNLSQKLGELSASFEKEGFKVQKQDIQGVGGLVVNVPEEMRNEFPLEKVYLAANETQLSFSTSEQNAARLFNASLTDNGFQALKSSAEFGRTTSQLNAGGEQFSFGYFDVDRLIKAVVASPLGKEDPAAAQNMQQIPVASVAFARTMTETPADVMTLSLTPKNEEQKTFISGLSSSGKGEIFGKTPASLMFYVSLDGNILANAKKVTTSAMSPEETAALKDVLDLVDSIKSLGLGIKEAAPGSPFPDVLIAIETSSADKVQENLKQQLAMGLSASGMPFAGWQEKDIAGTKVNYSLTPLGIGVFMGASGEAVILSSSEAGLSDFLGSLKGGSGLMSTLSNNSKQVISNPAPLFAVYTNMERLASMMQSMQGTLAMFSGGQANVDMAQIEKLKKMGSVILGVDHQNGIIRIRSSYENPGAKKA